MSRLHFTHYLLPTYVILLSSGPETRHWHNPRKIPKPIQHPTRKDLILALWSPPGTLQSHSQIGRTVIHLVEHDVTSTHSRLLPKAMAAGSQCYVGEIAWELQDPLSPDSCAPGVRLQSKQPPCFRSSNHASSRGRIPPSYHAVRV
jgi:hypothetical protein